MKHSAKPSNEKRNLERLPEVLQLLDTSRDVLLSLGFKHPAVAYSRKKLDNADNLETTYIYLKILEKRIKLFVESPMFPGIKSWEQYDALGLKNTKEHQIRERRREDVKAFWRARPDILRKTKHGKSKSTAGGH